MSGEKTVKMASKSVIAASMLALALGSANQVNAADSFEIALPAGLACADFGLTITVTPSDHQVFKEWTDENGNPVRMLTAGKGNALEFVNDSTGATLLLKANGSVSHTTFNLDGSRTVSATGHNVIIMFPTDIPAGPSTTLYVGRVVYTVDPGEVFTIQKVSGKTTDICAALSE